MFSMRKNKAALVVIGAIAALTTLSACTSSHSVQKTAQQQESTAQAADSLTLQTGQPVPHFDWSQIRQTVISVEGAQAHVVQTTTFFFQQGMQDPYFICNSIGFPVASTTELTNPQQVVQDHNQYGGGNVAIGQQDPTGVYTGQSAGTYVICVQPNGQAEIQYAEPNVHTVGGPAAWDRDKHQIVLTGTSTVSVQVGQK